MGNEKKKKKTNMGFELTRECSTCEYYIKRKFENGKRIENYCKYKRCTVYFSKNCKNYRMK